ncbi:MULTISPECIES: MASE1 domain-containing protein [Anaeromyxobacter]|uniref:MASE1 domain-containing protein n=1 Tax=Anaeromyxobacter TaxID=161492 RepID=UPI001F5605DC|nr:MULTISPECIES: MASE1 domain-containing protein [unclassified Anaeromyxobacter]
MTRPVHPGVGGDPPPSQNGVVLGRAVAFFVAYLLLCRAGDAFSAYPGAFATYWPPVGLLAGALLLGGRGRERLALAGAAIAAEIVASGATGRSAALVTVNVVVDLLDAALAAALVSRLAGPRRPTASVRGVAALVLLGALAAPLAPSALGAASAMAHYGWSGTVQFLHVWRAWWTGDALGILVFAPLVVSWMPGRRRLRPLALSRAVEAAVVAAALGGSAVLVFAGGTRLERSYLLLPPLVWAGSRFGVRGASAGAAIVSLVGAGLTSRTRFLDPSTTITAADVQVQLLVFIAVATALVLGAALAERERTLSALAESEARFDAFLRHTPAVIFIKDAQGRVVTGNPSFARAHGLGLDELQGRSAAEMFSPTVAQRVAAVDRAVLENGEIGREEMELSGRSFVALKFRMPRGEEAPLLGGVALDVTDLRRAERALRLAQTALERGYAPVLILDPGGRITYANDAAQRLFGRGAAELVGRAVWDVDGGFAEAGWPARWEEIRTHGAAVLDGTVRRPEGRADAEVGLSHLAFDGAEYAIYTARDLTDRRRAEAAERLAAVGTLAAGMAHEINNPLTFVSANLGCAREALGARAGEPEVSEALQALDDAAEGTRRIARIIRDLGIVSRSRRDGRRPIDVRDEIAGAAKLAEHEIRHRARLVLRLDPVPPVLASEFQVGQVVLNLLVNAAHAIPEGDAAANEIRVTCRAGPGGEAVLEVSDTGAGIPAELGRRVFEPFFTTKPPGQGTGLGLSVCHGIVTGLGGRIELESEPGRGALFRVVLPGASEARPPEPSSPSAGHAERARILVVDDEPLIGSTVRRVLAGHDVDCMTDARAALARLAGGERFDVVLCDLMMPDLTGMDLHEALARAAPDAATRMVFITGGAFTDRARRFLEASGLPRVEKPFAPAVLREVVGALLAREQVRRAG